MASKATTEQIVEIPLSQITVKYDWNGRYVGGGDLPVWTEGSGDDEGEANEWQAFKASIADRGQDTAVIVRPKGQRYELCAGFRRYLAIEQIAKERGDKAPTIKAVIRNYNDLQARLVNLRENTERDDYRPADLCWTVAEAVKEYQRNKVEVTQTMLAADVGKSQGFVARLLAIANNLDPSILNEWRGLHRDVSVNKVYELSKLQKAEQKKEWTQLKQAQADRSAETTPEQKAATRLEGLKKKAHDLGFNLGRLVFDEILLPPAGEDFDAASVVNLCIKLPGGKSALKARQLKSVVKSCSDGYIAGNQEQEDESEESEQEAAE